MRAIFEILHWYFDETHCYTQHARPWSDTTVAGMKAFLGVLYRDLEFGSNLIYGPNVMYKETLQRFM